MESQQSRRGQVGGRGRSGARGRGGNHRDRQQRRESDQKPVHKDTPAPVQQKGVSSDEWAAAFSQGGGWGSVKIAPAATPEQPKPEPKPAKENVVETLLVREDASQKDEPPEAVEPRAEETKNTSNPESEATNQAAEPSKTEESKEEKKEPVVREFDPEKDAKDWHAIDLGSMLEKQNKKAKVVQAKPKIVTVKKAQAEQKLRLTKELQFSITHLEKMNKGFTNRRKINCFMNVMLQSLFACPGFFNLLQAIGSVPAKQLGLAPNGVVMKLVYVQKHLDSRTQFDKPFANPCIDGETIFEQLLSEYNPLQE